MVWVWCGLSFPVKKLFRFYTDPTMSKRDLKFSWLGTHESALQKGLSLSPHTENIKEQEQDGPKIEWLLYLNTRVRLSCIPAATDNPCSYTMVDPGISQTGAPIILNLKKKFSVYIQLNYLSTIKY